MSEFEGGFVIPPTTAAQGEIKVYDWAKGRVLADKQVIANVISIDCTRNSTSENAGTATIKVMDKDRTIFSNLDESVEIEIFLSEQSPMTYANKVWGGFLDEKKFEIEDSKILIIRASEYAQVLTDNLTSATEDAGENVFTSEEPGTIIKALMDEYQVEFTTDNVLDGTTSTMTAKFINKSLYECIKQVCDTFNYVFYINLDKDLVVRKASTIVNTPASDSLEYGNNIKTISEIRNKQFLVNSIRVFGSSSAVSATASDTTSISTYGTRAIKYAAPSLTTNTDCQNFGDAYIAAWKDPKESFEIKSRLLAYSSPLEYIPLISTPNNIDGQYQIIQLRHKYSKKGLYSEVTLSHKMTSLSLSLGQLMARLSQVEVTTYA